MIQGSARQIQQLPSVYVADSMPQRPEILFLVYISQRTDALCIVADPDAQLVFIIL